MTISAFPTPTPSRAQAQDVFDSAVEAFLTHLPTFVSEANAVAVAMNLNSTTDTSASSNAIGTGAKTFTVTAGKSFQPGMWLVIADSAAPTTNALFAQVTSYSGTTLVVNSYASIGSGTKTAWVISQSAPAALEGLYALVAGSVSQAFSVAAATAAAHAVRADQIQGASSLTAFTTGGTSTAYTLTPSPAIAAYAANQVFDVTFHVASGANPTLAISGVATPPNLVRQNVDGTYSNLSANDIPAGWKSRVVGISATQYLVEKVPPRRAIITMSRDLSVASGNVAYTGAGFKARKARLFGSLPNSTTWSDGESLGGSSEACLYGDSVAGQTSTYSTMGLFYISTGNFVSAAIASFDTDGVTITYTKTGSPTGTIFLKLFLEE